MSSRELLVLIRFSFPEDSATKTAMPDGIKNLLGTGDWPMALKVQARIANEMALSRADGGNYMPDMILSPVERAKWDAEKQSDAAQQQAATDIVRAALAGEYRIEEPVEVIGESSREAIHSKEVLNRG